MPSPLYTTDMLKLAVSTATIERLPTPQGSAERRSQLCGSRVVVDVILNGTGQISALGMEVRACAFGQASSALLAQHAIGKSLVEIEAARDELSAYLAGCRDTPGQWPGLGIFDVARDHSARHPSIRLAFEAAADAVRRASSP
jgi:NifU-like protein involved in Fe-S cluster formation